MITYESWKLCSREYEVNSAPKFVLETWICSNTFDILRKNLSILQILLLFIYNVFCKKHYLKTGKKKNPHNKQTNNKPVPSWTELHRNTSVYKHIPQTSTSYLWSLCLLWATLPQLVLQLSIIFHITLLLPIHNNHKLQSFSCSLPQANFWSFSRKKSTKFILIFMHFLIISYVENSAIILIGFCLCVCVCAYVCSTKNFFECYFPNSTFCISLMYFYLWFLHSTAIIRDTYIPL